MPNPTTAITFSNPFEGRTSPMAMYAICLLMPEVWLKLWGCSIRGMFTQLGSESLYKRIKKGVSTPELLAELVTNMTAKLPDAPNVDLLKRLVAGDLDARDALNAKSDFTLFMEGLGVPLDTVHNAYVLEIEKAIKPVRDLLTNNDYALAVQAIRVNDLLVQFIPGDLLDALEAEQTQDKYVLVRMTSMLETHLSLIAASEVGRKRSGKLPLASVEHLLPTLPIQQHCPNARFFAWFKKVSNNRSLAMMTRKLELAGKSINEASLKRWSSGKVLPDFDSMRVMTEVLMTKADHESVEHLRMHAKLLNLLGHTAEDVVRKTKVVVGTPYASQLGHWPEYPFGCKDFVEWVNIRYRYWHDFHLERTSRQKLTLSAAS